MNDKTLTIRFGKNSAVQKKDLKSVADRDFNGNFSEAALHLIAQALNYRKKGVLSLSEATDSIRIIENDLVSVDTRLAKIEELIENQRNR